MWDVKDPPTTPDGEYARLVGEMTAVVGQLPEHHNVGQGRHREIAVLSIDAAMAERQGDSNG